MVHRFVHVVPGMWFAVALATCSPTNDYPAAATSGGDHADSGTCEGAEPTGGCGAPTSGGEECETGCTPPVLVWCLDDLESETYADIAVGPAGEIVVAGNGFLTGRVHVRDSDGSLLWEDELEGRAAAVLFRDTGSFVVYAETTEFSGDVGYTSAALHLYSTGGELLNEWRALGDYVPAPALARHPDGGYIVAGHGPFGTLRVSRLDADLQNLWWNTDAGDLGSVRGLAIGPDGRVFLGTSPARMFAFADDGSSEFLWMSEQDGLTLAGLLWDPSLGLLTYGGPQGSDWRAGVDPDTGVWTLPEPWPQVGVQLTELEVLEPGASGLGAVAAVASESGTRLHMIDGAGVSLHDMNLPTSETSEGGIQAIARHAPDGILVAGGSHRPTPEGPLLNWLCTIEL